MTNDKSKELLDRLQGCVVGFDPLAEHVYGTVQSPRVAMVPLPLYEDLVAFLKQR